MIGAGTGGLIGGLSSVASGGSFLDGFEDGAFLGAITGAIFGGIGGAGALFGKTITCGTKIANFISTTAKVSGGASLVMDGFDVLALGAGMNKLHSSKLYNAFQIGVNAVATFTGAASATMACFIAGTMVLTTAGLVAIENIKAGDIVISTNPDTLETAGKTVLETYVRQVDKLVHLTINGEEIVTTNNHPFYVQGRGFINAGNLLVGDKLISVNGEDLLIEDYRIELTEESVSVYNFQVEDYHTYFVGKSNIWTHNAECGGSYKEVCEKNKEYNSNQSDYIKKQHAHHMPACNAYPDDFAEFMDSYIGKPNGPAISMSQADHKNTASFGRRAGSEQYRADQNALLKQGKLQEAFDMDVKDIKSQFPGKYDSSIAEAQTNLNDLIRKYNEWKRGK